MAPIAMSIIGQLLKDREGYAKAEAHKRRIAEAQADAEKYTKLLREHSELRKKLEEVEQHDRDLKTMRKFVDACGMSAWDVTHPNVNVTDAIKAAAAAMRANDTLTVAMDRFALLAEQSLEAAKLFRRIYEADNSGNAKPAEEPVSVRDGLAGSTQAGLADN